ncbi:GntR family transcriptional regulator [Thermanaerovibrio acidaminovorans]|uniref:Transcriptional regulator, GntR family n=1 Tax=Thermanaerovibrio acidaminovorans (strain ATCC 49978 / DSM 6589 / Su883) TaxID=525903 RepID=D1B6M8_THEAS|nr:GntR family transcriptional regulator [Thermanaerovibrio acidaminovorans]ACZ19669.1 transcriptional regulator, GntR family [Thermanaerovibrio acidaminovorans DSM 6589]
MELNLKSLREQVYEYLKREMNEGRIKQGSFLDLGEISRNLGMSKTPLRDALFQLEAEGFVTIYPRRGIMVNQLDLQTIKNIYEILGALEGAVVVNEAVKIGDPEVARMRELNSAMREALEYDDFNLFYKLNLDFHNTYLSLSENRDLLHTVRILKERLYDFPRSKGFVREWELNSVGEHDQLVDLLDRRDFNGAAEFIRDVHWSFQVQERFIRKYYFASQNELDPIRDRGQREAAKDL